MSTSSIKRQIRRFYAVVVQWTSKKCTKKRDARAELLFWSLNLPVVFLKSSLWSSSWLLKLPIRRRVRTHEKNSGDAARRLGTIIQCIFCAQSEASIRLTVWKWSGESPARLTAPGSPRMRRALLENLTDRCGFAPSEKFKNTTVIG